MDIESLSPLLASCPYPDNVKAIDRGIEGDGYYPGARGFARGSDPTGGIMLVGRDFGLHSYYLRRSQIPNASETMYTWQRTVDCILQPLSGTKVWAVNYLLGARKQPPAIGNLKDLVSGGQWQIYEEFCWNFLKCAVFLQKPKHIVVLGGSNHDELISPNRLHLRTHTFSENQMEHTAKVHCAPHPSSLRSHVARDKARAWYRSLAYEQDRKSL